VWVFCGSWLDVAYVEKLERRVREAGLEMHVRILPEREDLPDLYSAADVAVLASIHPDPFPNVAFEAMGSGLPLVAPKEGALAHVIRDERDGLHFTPRDADSLASALAALLSSPERRAEFGASARARVLADFTLQSMVNGHCRVYQEVLGG
jgi:glycosyltransferase involved in cell wall biosynthesis